MSAAEYQADAAASPPCDFDTTFFLPFAFGPQARRSGRKGGEAPPVPKQADVRAAAQTLVRVLTARTGAPASAIWRPAPAGEFLRNAEFRDERHYLHPFARQVLADQVLLRPRDTPWGRPRDGEHAPNWPLSLVLPDGRTVGGLVLTDVNIHIFETGVGVLALRISGSGALEDMLCVNEVFRWFGRDYADRPVLHSFSVNDIAYDAFDDDADSEPPELVPQSSAALRCHSLIDMLLGARAATLRTVWVQPVLDWRMVVLSWTAVHEAGPDWDVRWQEQLLVDTFSGGSFNPGPGPLGEAYTKELLDQHEYRRWWNDQRIGFTRYSAAFLGCRENGFFHRWVRKHCQTVYYSLALLTLLHRTKLLELSRESADVAEGLARRPVPPGLAGRVRRLREDFLLFSTRYWFIELTDQDQGIDMSRQWSKVMDNERLFGELREEIERFEAYQSQRSAERTGTRVQVLTIVLGIFALFTGLLGANYFPRSFGFDPDDGGTAFGWMALAALLIVPTLVYGMTAVIDRIRDRWR